MNHPPSLDALITALRVLPGIGPKSAQRMVYHLLQRDQAGAAKLAHALHHALSHVQHCRRCNTFSESDLCYLCADEARSATQLCVVEMPADMLMLEQAGCYQGYYFVLMGRISPLDAVGVQDVPLQHLLARVLDEGVEEVIIATNFTAEGEATAHVLSELLRARGVRISRIARGLPVGGELEYVDPGTLAQALYERRTLPDLDV